MMDPYFGLRMYFRDFGHPRSPLSSTTLVHRAFFCPDFPTANVKTFELNIPEYESILWPLGMMFSFVNVRNVLGNLIGWGSVLKQRVLVIAGSKDTLMGVVLMRRMAERYRKEFAALKHSRVAQPDTKDDPGAVGFTIIEGSGHHIQNDLQWEDSASQILAFVQQL